MLCFLYLVEALGLNAIIERHNSLGWLAWHLVGAGGAFGHFVRLQVPMIERDAAIPNDMPEIIKKYQTLMEAYQTEVAKLIDDRLLEEVNGFTGSVARGIAAHFH